MRATVTAKVKLDVTPEANAALAATQAAYVRALNLTSEVAHRTGVTGGIDLHHLTYRDVRAATRLPANLTCSARAVVAEAYAREPKPERRHRWRDRAGIRFDARTLTLKLTERRATLSTLSGRVGVGLVISDYHRQYLDGSWDIAATATLTRSNGAWFLHLVCTREVEESTATGVLGVDAGIKRVATTSGATVHRGGPISQLRRRRFRQRRSLSTGHPSRGQRRLRQRLREREHRAVEWRLWNVANAIVREAIASGCGRIALEELTHIRTRIRAAKKQRVIQQGWPFASLQAKVTHVASKHGIGVEWVDARNTSRGCNRCGHVDEANRADQSTFRCVACSHTVNADVHAAFNIRDRCVDLGCAARKPALATGSRLSNTREVRLAG
jgi:putative transposase